MSDNISPDTTIAGYTIVSKLGEGGMGEVWRARDPKLGRELFYVAPDRKVMAVDVNLATIAEVGTPQPLFTAGVLRYDAPNRYAVSADGQRFLVNTAVQGRNETPITVVLNWSVGLKK